MARKKSIKLSAQTFRIRADEIVQFATAMGGYATQGQESWIYDYAVIRLYREFENLMLVRLDAGSCGSFGEARGNFDSNFPSKSKLESATSSRLF